MQVTITTNGTTRNPIVQTELMPHYSFLQPIIDALRSMDRLKSIYFPDEAGGLKEAHAILDQGIANSYRIGGTLKFVSRKNDLQQAYVVEIKERDHLGGYHLKFRVTGKSPRILHPSGTEGYETAEEVIAALVRNYTIGAPYRKVIPLKAK